MQMNLLTTIVAAALVWGCEKKAETSPPPPDTAAHPAQPATTSAAAPAGPVIEVQMTGNGTSKAAFAPRYLTIAPGTTVRFVNISGGPHNIAFWKDSVPKDGIDALRKGMPNAMTDLTGPFLTRPNEHYDVSFAGVPAGIYKGYCQPHLVLGMRITIKVK